MMLISKIILPRLQCDRPFYTQAAFWVIVYIYDFKDLPLQRKASRFEILLRMNSHSLMMIGLGKANERLSTWSDIVFLNRGVSSSLALRRLFS